MFEFAFRYYGATVRFAGDDMPAAEAAAEPRAADERFLFDLI